MIAFKNRHSVEATRTPAERLVTDHVLEAGRAVVLPIHEPPPGSIPYEQVFHWPYAVIAFHDCVDYPNLPCPACLNIENEELGGNNGSKKR